MPDRRQTLGRGSDLSRFRALPKGDFEARFDFEVLTPYI